MNSPLDSNVLFQFGPVPITQAIVTTWVIMAILVIGAFVLTRRLDLRPTRRQAALELMVATLDTQITETTGATPAPYRGFIGTLFIFILAANWSSLVPGIDPPTAQLETDAGLAVLVFLSVIWFGIRAGGVGGWLKVLCSTQSGDDPAEYPAKPHAGVFHVRPAFRQRDERRLRDWHRRLAGGPLGADPADGARSADRTGAGLYLCGAGDGVHHLRRRGRHAHPLASHPFPIRNT